MLTALVRPRSCLPNVRNAQLRTESHGATAGRKNFAGRGTWLFTLDKFFLATSLSKTMKTASAKSFPIHPAAALFPLMGPDELSDLANDIKTHGLRKAITLFDGQVLDGRNRLKACEMAGVEPFFETLAYCPSPTEWVVSINLHRRHLTASQRAAIGFEIMPLLEEEAKKRRASGLKQNGSAVPEKIPERDKGESREKAAAIVDVNPHYMSDLKKIQAEAPEKIEEIKAGTISIGAAKKALGKNHESEPEEDEPEDSEQLATVKRLFIRLPKTERALFLRWAKENFA